MRFLLAAAASLVACVPVICLPHSPVQPQKRALSGIIADPASVAGQAFDYVIVGGGLTGIVAATRLSEESNKRVLLVEAGGDTRGDDKIKTFRAYSQAFGDDRYDWAFPTRAQAASGNKSYPMHQGKGLGGSSSINGGAFTLPPASQSECSTCALFPLAVLTHAVVTSRRFGDAGEQRLELQRPTALHEEIANVPRTQPSCECVGGNGGHGLPRHNGPHRHWLLRPHVHWTPRASLPRWAIAGTRRPHTHRPGQWPVGRRSADPTNNAARLWRCENPGERRDGLSDTVCAGEGKPGGRDQLPGNADGLPQFNCHPHRQRGAAAGPQGRYTVSAKRVIVAAGAIRTPVFLELSGIGDDGVIRSIGVQQRVSLPGVGRNLCEQQKNSVVAGPPRSPIGGSVSPSSAISMNTLGQLVSNASDIEWATLASLDKWAQQAVEQGGAASKEGLLLQYRTMVDGIFHRDWPIAETFFVSTKNVLIQQMWALLSFSRGYVHAASPSTWDVPELEPRYWSASIDMDMQVAANRGARRVFESTAMKDVLAGGESAPGYATIAGSSEGGAYGLWRQYILDSFESVWHPLGTAAMLPEASGGVVDAGFKVYHTQNIYVIDASILPMQISTHLTSVLYGVAEKAAAMLKTA